MGSVVTKAPAKDMVRIPGGTFMMGSNEHYPEEAPAHPVTVDGFWMDQFTVTNAQFSRFVEETHYVTSAERAPRAEDYRGAQPELLVPASVVFYKPQFRVDLKNHFNWWTYIPGASWRHPLGPNSSLKGLAKHPVVHVAFEDAQAYAMWAGKELQVMFGSGPATGISNTTSSHTLAADRSTRAAGNSMKATICASLVFASDAK